MQTQSQSLIDQIQGCLTSIQAETSISPTNSQIETLQLLLTVTQRAHRDIIKQSVTAPVQLKLPAEDLGIQNFSENKGRQLARQLKHSGGTLRNIGDSHSAWGGNVKTQVKPTYVTAGGLTLSID